MDLFKKKHYIQKVCVLSFLSMSLSEASAKELSPVSNLHTKESSDSIFEQPDVVRTAKAVLASLTLDEKIAQLFMIEINALSNPHVSSWLAKNTPGAFLYSAGFAHPLAYTKSFIKETIKSAIAATPNKVPIFISADNIHGSSLIEQTPVFPHNINYTHMSLEHVRKNALAAGKAVAAFSWEVGINMTLAPTVAVSHDLRWGRNYESAGRDLHKVRIMGESFVAGAQQIKQFSLKNGSNVIKKKRLIGVLATAKHFIGDGDSFQGRDKFLSLLGSDNGATRQAYYDRNGAGYFGAIDSDVGCVMLDYGSSFFNEKEFSTLPSKNLPHHYDSTAIVRLRADREDGGFGFKGYVLSDYEGPLVSDVLHIYTQELQPGNPKLPSAADSKTAFKTAHSDPKVYCASVVKCINAGCDQMMLGLFVFPFENIIDAVKKGVSEERINKACETILRVKAAMGLFDTYIYADKKLNSDYKKEAVISSYQSALDSFYFTGNNHTPLIARDKTLLLLGREQEPNPPIAGKPRWFAFYDDLGIQCGGWTLGSFGVAGYYSGSVNKLPHKTGDRSTRDYWNKLAACEYTHNGKTILGASTIRDGLHSRGIRSVPIFSLDQLNEYSPENAHALVVLGEFPYFETHGDVENNTPFWNDFTNFSPFIPKNSSGKPDITLTTIDVSVILKSPGVDLEGTKISLETYEKLKRAYQKGINITTVILTGRKLHIDAPLNKHDAPFGNKTLREVSVNVVYAYLPGTSGGQAIVDFLVDTPRR